MLLTDYAGIEYIETTRHTTKGNIMSSRKHYRLTLDNLRMTLHGFGDAAEMPLRRMMGALQETRKVAGTPQKVTFAAVRDSYISEIGSLDKTLDSTHSKVTDALNSLVTVLQQEDDFNAYTTEATARVLSEMESHEMVKLSD